MFRRVLARCLALLALLAVLAPLTVVTSWVQPARATTPDATDPTAASRAQVPVRPGSPAWLAVMDLPLRDGDSLSHAAADLLQRWQQPAAAQSLRRTLLLIHLRHAGGQQALPAPEAQVSTVWQPEAPEPTLDALQQALQTALDTGLQVTARPDRPAAAGGQAEPQAQPGLPGFGRADDTGRVRVLLTVKNRAPLRLAPGSLQAQLRWAGQDRTQPQTLALRCVLQPAQPRDLALAPGQSAPMACVSDNPLPPVNRWPDQWTWQPALLGSDAGVEALAKALQHPQSTRFASLAAAQGSCTQQDNCTAAQQQARMLRVQARQQTIGAQEAARKADREAEDKREARTHRRNQILVVAFLIGGQIVFVLLARLTGSVVPSTVLVMGGSLVLSAYLFQAAGTAGTDTFAPIILLCLAAGALMAGVLLCKFYAAVYRKFFQTE